MSGSTHPSEIDQHLPVWARTLQKLKEEACSVAPDLTEALTSEPVTGSDKVSELEKELQTTKQVLERVRTEVRNTIIKLQSPS